MLGLPGGQVLVALVGLGIVVTGGLTVWNGWKKNFVDDMTLPIDPMVRSIVERIGQVGFIAKGLALVLVGVLVVVAALRFDPAQAIRPRRRAQDARRPAVRAVPAARDGARALRLRGLLLLRRPVPPHQLMSSFAVTSSRGKTSRR